MPSQPVTLQRGNLVRLKSTGALFEVKEVKGEGRLIIADGPSVLNVGEHAVTVVREFNPRSEVAGEASELNSESGTGNEGAGLSQS